jgi:LacI family transcriptional regulator
MKASEHPATIYDVATLAGVSHQTVTRFLHGSGPVRQATAARVEQAIVELGYRPNLAARQLRLRRSNRIGVLEISSPHFGPVVALLREANRMARDLGYFLHVELLEDDDDSALRNALDDIE